MMAGKFSNMRYVPGTSRGSQSDTAECAERVEAMLSTAILQQEDICNLLLLVFPDGNNTFDGAVDSAGRSSSAMVEVPPEFLMAMKTKVEAAMDWCQLAQLRLQGVLNDTSAARRRQSPSLPYLYNGPSSAPNYSGQEMAMNHYGTSLYASQGNNNSLSWLPRHA
jgi:hypothetical protein